MDTFVARQPIFGLSKQVYGYELLYRNSLDQNCFDENINADEASSRTILNSFVEIGLSKLTSGRKAFVNFTEHLLEEMVPLILPKEILVVEILETIQPTPEILESCRALKEAGYTIALDDFIICEENYPFLEFADVIKVDFITTTLQDIYAFVTLLPQITAFRSQPICLLAEKVEDFQTYQIAVEMGFQLFQGYYFSKPVIVSGKTLSPLVINQYRVLALANTDEIDFPKMARLISKDVALSFRLLKIVNSAYFSPGRKIRGILHALVSLGSKEIRKWAALLCVMGDPEDSMPELTRMALIRAYFLGAIAPKVNMGNQSEALHLLGLFSLIDVMMECPMNEVLAQIQLEDSITYPLLEQCGKSWDLLSMVIEYEHGDFQGAARISQQYNLEPMILGRAYMDAIDYVTLLEQE
jgi:EAL and modified HD-GYP domain-containing signal transduction protein